MYIPIFSLSSSSCCCCCCYHYYYNNNNNNKTKNKKNNNGTNNHKNNVSSRIQATVTLRPQNAEEMVADDVKLGLCEIATRV